MVVNSVVVGASVYPVVFFQGQLLITPIPDEFFLRGDADGNGSVAGLPDGLFLLNFAFVAGSPAPPCFDAADIDGSGAVNGLVDGLFVLNYQFVSGSTPPPAPGPVECGPDPTVDAVICTSYPICP